MFLVWRVKAGYLPIDYSYLSRVIEDSYQDALRQIQRLGRDRQIRRLPVVIDDNFQTEHIRIEINAAGYRPQLTVGNYADMWLGMHLLNDLMARQVFYSEGRMELWVGDPARTEAAPPPSKIAAGTLLTLGPGAALQPPANATVLTFGSGGNGNITDIETF